MEIASFRLVEKQQHAELGQGLFHMNGIGKPLGPLTAEIDMHCLVGERGHQQLVERLVVVPFSQLVEIDADGSYSGVVVGAHLDSLLGVPLDEGEMGCVVVDRLEDHVDTECGEDSVQRGKGPQRKGERGVGFQQVELTVGDPGDLVDDIHRRRSIVQLSLLSDWA